MATLKYFDRISGLWRTLPPGPKGDKGDQGDQGIQGIQGIKGDQGEPGLNLVSSVAGKTGAVTLDKSDVGLSNVDNTSDASKPISTAAQTAIDTKLNSALFNTAMSQIPDRYAGNVYNVLAKTQAALIPTSYGLFGHKFDNEGYTNDLNVYGKSTQSSTPSAETVVPIVNTTGNVQFRSSTLNLLNIPDATVSRIGTTVNVSNQLVTISSTSAIASENTFDYGDSSMADYIKTPGTDYNLTPNGGVYTLRIYVENFPTLLASEVRIQAVNGSGVSRVAASNTMTSSSIINGVFTLNITLASDEHISNVQHYIYVGANRQYNDWRMRLTLVAGAYTGAYIPYATSLQTLALGSTQMRSLPNGVSDRILKRGDNWYFEQNVGIRTINGTENWLADIGFGGTDGSYRYKISLDAFLYNIQPAGDAALNLMSERFTSSTNRIDGVISANVGVGSVRLLFVNTLTYATVAGFKAALAAQPFTVQMGLASPVITQITDSAQIAALESIRTYRGATTLTATTPISGSYGVDIKSYTDSNYLLKSGDTISGVLASTAATLGFTQTRGGFTWRWGAVEDNSFGIWSNTANAYIVSVGIAGLYTARDIEVTDPTKGVVIRSPNGTRFRITVGNDGALTTTAI